MKLAVARFWYEGNAFCLLGAGRADLAGQEWDGIYLSLHGAAITQRRETPEIDLVQALCAAHPRSRIAASFDLHANHDPRWVSLLEIACGYRTYPHVDMVETAARSLRLLENQRRAAQ